MGTDRCICCGAIIPEGMMVCPKCDSRTKINPIGAFTPEQLEWCATLDGNCIQCKFQDECKLSRVSSACQSKEEQRDTAARPTAPGERTKDPMDFEIRKSETTYINVEPHLRLVFRDGEYEGYYDPDPDTGAREPNESEPRIAMISQPMRGLTDKKIAETQSRLAKELKKKGYYVLNTLFKDSCGEEDMKRLGIKHRALYMLGLSLAGMSRCDAVIFANGWRAARGCYLEYLAAQRYGLKILFDKEEDVHPTWKQP
jgi:hypothetical protein